MINFERQCWQSHSEVPVTTRRPSVTFHKWPARLVILPRAYSHRPLVETLKFCFEICLRGMHDISSKLCTLLREYVERMCAEFRGISARTVWYIHKTFVWTPWDPKRVHETRRRLSNHNQCSLPESLSVLPSFVWLSGNPRSMNPTM